MQVDLYTILSIIQYMRDGTPPTKLAYAILCQDGEQAHQEGHESDSTDDPVSIEEIDNMLKFIKMKAFKLSFGSQQKVDNWIKNQGFKGKYASTELQMKLEGTTWMWWL